MLTVAGEPNSAVRENWETVLRSFKKKDGWRRVRDLAARMEPVEIEGRPRHIVYPGRDERVVRILRKIVRGLCHHHGLLGPIPDSRVLADVLVHVVPQEFRDMMESHHRERDIVEYEYGLVGSHQIHSAWLLTFFETRTFIALVSSSENGFDEH